MVSSFRIRLHIILSEGDNLNENQKPNSKNRKYLILARLFNNEHLSYQRLADDYFVSRSSIANDIAFIKELLAKDNVALNFDNSGTYVGSDEIAKQKVIKRLVIDFMNGGRAKQYIPILIQTDVIEPIRKTVIATTDAWQLQISDSYVTDIVVSTSVLVSRGRSGFHINLDLHNQLGTLLLSLDKYPLIYELLKSVENAQIYEFSQDELRYLSYVVLGGGFRYFVPDTSIPETFKRDTQRLIRNVSHGINIDLEHDNQLREDLTLHLFQMALRLKFDTTVVNPLLGEIKRDYPTVFVVVWYALIDFANNNGLVVSDDEVAFVTIHFQAAIERSKRQRRILFVCLNGIGTSSLISAKMRQILPEVSLIEIISRAALPRQDLSNVDLIISTVSLPVQVVPVVQISPMITNEDMKSIMSQYIDVVTTKNRQPNILSSSSARTISMLRENIFFEAVDTQAEAIDYLLSKNLWRSSAELANYRESVIRREKLQSTYLGNGFALPHGNPQLIQSSHISILIPGKQIYWGNNKVDVVVMLMVAEKDKKTIEPIMELIMQGVNNKDWFLDKMMEVR